MDLPALQSDIKNLESALDSLGRWLLFATFLVVLGLVLEVIHEIPEAIRSLKKSWSWEPLCVIAGGLLITVGVAGELFVQYGASRKEAALRTANDTIVANLNAEAANARERASALEREAEAERLERTKLEAIVSPRSLSLEQQRQIASACRRFDHHGVLVTSYGLDGEGAALGGQIISTLKSAGIIVADGRSSIVVTGGFESGVHVRGPDSERDFVLTLGKALGSIGKLQVALNDSPPRAGATMGGGGQSFQAGAIFVTVAVGVKPLPVLEKSHP